MNQDEKATILFAVVAFTSANKATRQFLLPVHAIVQKSPKVKKGQDKKGMTQNIGFINNMCELCGSSDIVMSAVRLSCNYGSKYDGEKINLRICGDCADKLFEFIQKENFVKKS